MNVTQLIDSVSVVGCGLKDNLEALAGLRNVAAQECDGGNLPTQLEILIAELVRVADQNGLQVLDVTRAAGLSQGVLGRLIAGCRLGLDTLQCGLEIIDQVVALRDLCLALPEVLLISTDDHLERFGIGADAGPGNDPPDTHGYSK